MWIAPLSAAESGRAGVDHARRPYSAGAVGALSAGNVQHPGRFVDPGESLEETVVREVREEVGIESTYVRYFGSQPWPFPSSLMVAFTADYAAGELAPDRVEIEEAAWYAVDEIPVVPPPISLARALIDHFVREHGGDPDALRTSA
jgi:8-oxo-dGTP pyrophosphatase MutT (NUDIX family)